MGEGHFAYCSVQNTSPLSSSFLRLPLKLSNTSLIQCSSPKTRNQFHRQRLAKIGSARADYTDMPLCRVPADKARVPPGVGSRLGSLGFLEWWFQAATSDKAELTYVVDNRLSRRSDAIAGQHQATFQRGNERGNF